MARVLITGSTGLIGRWTLAHWPRSIAPVEISHLDHDLTDPTEFIRAIRDVEPDAVLHLAWCASGDPGYRSSPDNERWVESTWRAASFCLEAGIRFVGTGTVLDLSPAPTDAYARAKHTLRNRLSTQIATGSITWLRPFYVFDPEARRPALVADAQAARAAGMPVDLRSPRSSHDFVHASDVGAAVAAVMVSGLAGAVDIGSGTSRTVEQMALACGARTRVHAEAAETSEGAVADSSRLRATGWLPRATDEFFGNAGPA